MNDLNPKLKHIFAQKAFNFILDKIENIIVPIDIMVPEKWVQQLSLLACKNLSVNFAALKACPMELFNCSEYVLLLGILLD